MHDLPAGLTKEEFERVVQAAAMDPDQTFDLLTDAFNTDDAVAIMSEAMVVLSELGGEAAADEAYEDFEDGASLEQIARVYGQDVADMVEEHELAEATRALGDHLDEVGEIVRSHGLPWEPGEQGHYLGLLEAHEGDVEAAVEQYFEAHAQASDNAAVEAAIDARIDHHERVADKLVEVEEKNPSRDSLDAAINEFVADQAVTNARTPKKHSDAMDDALDDLVTVLDVQKQSGATDSTTFTSAQREQLARESFERLAELKAVHGASATPQTIYVETVGDDKTDEERIADHRARSRQENARLAG